MTDRVRRRPDRNYAPDVGAAPDASSALRRSDEPTLDQLLAEPIVQLLMHCDRTNEVTIRDLLHQASAAGPASQAIESPSADDPTTIVGLLDETARLARTRYDRELRARLPGMTWARCAVLIHLAQHKAVNQTSLAQILAIRPITLVRLLDRLEAAGFVERMPDPNDRRAHILALTAKALPIIESIRDLNRSTCGNLQLGISEVEASQLRALLSRIRTHLALLAGLILRIVSRAERLSGSSVDHILVKNWLPDYSDQTASQKAADVAAGRNGAPVERPPASED